ncbi:hypothetical protein LCM4573_18015 [Rhizobium sp. LCM 4573]|nr:hypothetical protein LCM4573_18015 [Rhizobium sp. LCM 4573]
MIKGRRRVPYQSQVKLYWTVAIRRVEPGNFLDITKYLRAEASEIATPTMFDIFESRGEAV